MDPNTFREYDIRGIVGEEIQEEDVVLLGKAFGSYLARQQKRYAVIGRDCRLSSELFRDCLVAGMLTTGLEVIDIGVVPTPVFYFAIRHLNRDGGVMITASHNPPEYNGFKICSGFDTIYGAEIQSFRTLMAEGDFATGAGQSSPYDILTPYMDFVVGNIQMPRRLRVGVDAGNATAGPVILPVLERLGCEVFPLYCDMDGTFPNHEPDPTVLDNLVDLRALVKRERLEVGIAFDGDGDRLGVVDHRGEPVFGDKLMLIFAREILSRRSGTTFISEVKCSQTLFDDIRKRGGKAVMWRTGHSLIKAKMKEVDAVLAGEMSGHMFFKDRYFGFDDGLYAACRLLEILANRGKTIPELLEGVPVTCTTPEIRVPCPDPIKFEVVEQAKRRFREMNLEIIEVDGARIVFQDGWGLVRASNTQPVLVLRYEAGTPERLNEIRALVEGVIEAAREAISP